MRWYDLQFAYCRSSYRILFIFSRILFFATRISFLTPSRTPSEGYFDNSNTRLISRWEKTVLLN